MSAAAEYNVDESSQCELKLINCDCLKQWAERWKMRGGLVVINGKKFIIATVNVCLDLRSR